MPLSCHYLLIDMTFGPVECAYFLLLLLLKLINFDIISAYCFIHVQCS